jgi:hypothetical protein
MVLWFDNIGCSEVSCTGNDIRMAFQGGEGIFYSLTKLVVMYLSRKNLPSTALPVLVGEQRRLEGEDQDLCKLLSNHPN